MKTITVIYIAIWFCLIGAAIIGEIKCIIKAVNCNWEPIGKAEICYTVACCTGAGCVVGYLDIQDK